jgi:hypothetical protein
MSVDTDFDYFSCYLDLLGYQKNEITDSISQMLNIRVPILEEGLLLCTFKLPTNNYDFKMCLRKFCHYPLLLEKFSIEIGNETVIKCRLVYDTCDVLSKPLFRFPNRQFKNIEMLRKQLKTLNFTYKVLKSHLFFQIMQHNGIGTDVEFHYNATKDCFATSPSGMDYSAFIEKHKLKITSIKAYHAALVMPAMPAPALGLTQMVSQAPPVTTPNLSSVPPATQAAPLPAAVTPHRHMTFDGESSRPSVRRNLYSEALNLESRSRHSSDAAKTCATTTRLALTNTKIVKEIAQSKGLVCSSDVVEEMFHTKSSWNIARWGMLSLALQGIIPLMDNRFTLDDNQEGEEGQDNLSTTVIEVVPDKDLPK